MVKKNTCVNCEMRRDISWPNYHLNFHEKIMDFVTCVQYAYLERKYVQELRELLIRRLRRTHIATMLVERLSRPMNCVVRRKTQKVVDLSGCCLWTILYF